MNSRLLHAAARGARIQVHIGKNSWLTVTYAVVLEQLAAYRIHPSDEHLAYGPVSTALRDAATYGDALDLSNWYGRMADAAASHSGCMWWHESLNTRCLYLLILAEVLADEGL